MGFQLRSENHRTKR